MEPNDLSCNQMISILKKSAAGFLMQSSLLQEQTNCEEEILPNNAEDEETDTSLMSVKSEPIYKKEAFDDNTQHTSQVKTELAIDDDETTEEEDEEEVAVAKPNDGLAMSILRKSPESTKVATEETIQQPGLKNILSQRLSKIITTSPLTTDGGLVSILAKRPLASEIATLKMSKKRSFDLKFKLDVIQFAEKTSGEAAAKHYQINSKQIREWKKQKASLGATISKNKPLKRLQGAGRKTLCPILDERLFEWILEQKSKSLRVSRRLMRQKAKEIFANLEPNPKFDFKASIGWLDKFLKRKGLHVAQKAPEQLHEKIISFVLYMSHLNKNVVCSSSIVAMDETSLWLDMAGNQTVDVVTGKKSTRNKKAHATVVLAAKGDGAKLKPFIVFKNSIRAVKAMASLDQATVVSSPNGWMNEELTKEWLDCVYGKLSFGKRILVWDSCKCHVSEVTTEHLKEFNTDVAVIPGSCTKYIQAPDVAWNKPFKDQLNRLYEIWMAGTDHKEYTKEGNLKAPAKVLLVEWVMKAWDSLSPELIKESFKACALTTATDGSEDDLIHCLKEGQTCHAAMKILKEKRVAKFVPDKICEDDDDSSEELEHSQVVIGDSVEDNATTDNDLVIDYEEIDVNPLDFLADSENCMESGD